MKIKKRENYNKKIVVRISKDTKLVYLNNYMNIDKNLMFGNLKI